MNDKNEIRQEANEYSIKESPSKDNVGNPQLDKSDMETKSEIETRPNSWGVKGEFLTSDDYYIYLTTKDEIFKRKVENIIEKLQNPKDQNKKPFDFSNMEKEAKAKIAKEQRQQEKKELVNRVDASEATIVKLKNGELLEVTIDNVMDFAWENADSIAYVNGDGSDKVIHHYSFNELYSDCFMETRTILLEALKERLLQGKFTSMHVHELTDLKEETIKRNNQLRSYNEVWEGDVFHFDGEEGRNLSLQQRIRDFERKKKIERKVAI